MPCIVCASMSFKEVLINTSRIFTHFADEHDFLRSDKSTSPLSPVITAQQSVILVKLT